MRSTQEHRGHSRKYRELTLQKSDTVKWGALLIDRLYLQSKVVSFFVDIFEK